MILADKIVRLRKQFGWSQEELAERMNVSRQSVSKWESASSIPDLNKIILLSEIFGVSTDYLLRDEVEEDENLKEDKEPGIIRITLEEATAYVDSKKQTAKLVAKGVLLCIYSIIPLLFLLALSESNKIAITSDTATGIGLAMLFVMIAMAVSFFIRSNQYMSGITDLEEVEFELAYGVKSIFKERIKNFQGAYTQRMSLSVTMCIISPMPLILAGIFANTNLIYIMMLVVLFILIGAGVYLMIPYATENKVYYCIIKEGEYAPDKRESYKRSEKLATVYWPIVTAVYIGWSLWTMDWHITWIIWPVTAVAFAAILGLSELFSTESRRK